MKKALALTLTLVLGLSFGLIAADFSVGDLSGTWETEFSIGYTDVVITDPGATLIIPGGTYDVTEGFVTIPDQTVTGTYQGESYTVTHPGGTYTVGPWDITIPGGTYDVTLGSVTIPEQIIPVQLPDGPVEVTLPEYTFDIPDFLNKDCKVDWDDTYAVTDPTADWQYGGIENYVVDTPGAGPGAPAASDAGITTVQIENGALGAFDWCTLEFAAGGAITATAFTRQFNVPIGGGLYEIQTFTFTPSAYTPDHDDLVNGYTDTLVATGTAPDSLGRVWTATITVPLNWTLVDPLLTIPAGSLVGTCVYDNKTLEFELANAITAAPLMPAGWPLPIGTFTTPCGPVTVEFGYDDQGWVHVQPAFGEPMGFCLLDFQVLVYDVVLGVAQVTVLGDALFATFEDGTQTVTLPAQILTGTYTGGTVDITVPAQTVAVSQQTVTIPDYSFVVPADTIVIPDFTFTITVADQDIPITIAGGTYNVYSASLQTVTIPSQTVLVPGWSQTIADVVTLGVESTLTVDYLISGWLFGMVLVVDETGMTGLDFSAGGALGAFSISSSLGFDPALVAFEEWNVVTGVSIAGVTLGADFTLVPNDVSLLLSGSGVAGEISIAVDVSFGIPANELCDLSWAGVDIEIGIPFYCADLDMTLIFDCEGFDSLTFSVTGIAVPSFPWITIAADLTFTVDAKTLVISPDVSFGTGVCIDLYMDLGYAGEGPLTVTDFTIYGIGIVADFGGGVTFTGLSSFDEVNFDLILDPYWEVYTIATTDDGCCGPFNFDVSVYFLEGGLRLFDIAYLEANMSLQVAAQLEFTTGVELDIENEDFTLWTVGLNVSW